MRFHNIDKICVRDKKLDEQIASFNAMGQQKATALQN